MRCLTSPLKSLLACSGLILLLALPTAAQVDEAAATRLMIEAQRLSESGSRDAALLEYKALVDRFPRSTLAPQALAESARIRFELGGLDAAAVIAERLIEEYSSSGEGAAGLVLKARILVERATTVEQLNEALTLLKRLPNLYGRVRYPLLEPRAEGRVLAGELLIQLGDLGAAAASFVEVIEDEPRGRFTLRAHIGLGRVLALKGQQIAALEAFQLAIDEGLGNDDITSQRAVADARDRLSLLYRFWIRPTLAEKPWTKTETIRPAGIEWKKPDGVAVNADREVLVSDGAVGLVRIDSSGKSTAAAVRSPGRPFVDHRGSFYAPLGSSIRRLEPPESRSFQSGGDKPKALDKIDTGARGPLGHWFLLDRSSDGVQVFLDDGTPKPPLGAGLDIRDISVDERGRLYVLSQRPSKISIFGLDGQVVSSFTGTWSKPTSLAVDWLGNIYVLDASENSVAVLNGKGEAVATIPASLPGVGALRSPTDIAVSPSGQVYLTDSRLQTVYRLD